MRLGAAGLCAMLGAASFLPAGDVATPQAVLAEGIALVQQGDFEAAVLKLDEASRRLAADPSIRAARPPAAGLTRPLADAYLYLGISYLELNQELNARAKFREVLKVEPTRKLSDRVFSPQIIRVFEAARVEMFPNEKKKRNILPLLLIAGGGTASAAVAVAASGGDEPPPTQPATSTTSTLTGTGGGNPTSTSTTIATDPGGPNPTTTTTTTTTTLPGATTTVPASTTLPTTLPGSTSTTSSTTTSTTSSTTSTTSTTTTTTTLACSYSLDPPSKQFDVLGGAGVCRVTTQPGCAWTATKDGDQNAGWVTFTGATSGSGTGDIAYNVGAITILSRTARISITQDPSEECVINQSLLRPDEGRATEAATRWESDLSVDGGRGQIVIDGASVRYQDQGLQQDNLPAGSGQRQIVAQLVAAKGRPGTWTFRLPGVARPGSVRPLSGNASSVTGDSIAFRLAGTPGERLVFTFQAVP
jgi:hypothetical protein